ncbi:MAG TPA: hypothetical protein VE959_29115 [Bryobacteraceae bacterium]|nr:hypothetical protein [Bryobacteraceae bacterium]
MTTEEKRGVYRGLARNLCAAVLAHRMRVSFQTALRNHVLPDDQIDQSWHDLAEALDHSLTANLEALFSQLPKPDPKLIQ